MITNRIFNKNRSFYCTYLLLIYLLTFCQKSSCGLIELDHITMPNGKIIILLGDRHSKENTEEIQSLLDIIRAQEQYNHNIAFFIEQELESRTTAFLESCFPPTITRSFPKLLQKEALKKTTIENIEICTVSCGTSIILVAPYIKYGFFQNESPNSKVIVDEITFEKVYDEFEALNNTITTHYEKYTDIEMQECFAHYQQSVQEENHNLHAFFEYCKNTYDINKNDSITEAIKKINDVNDDPEIKCELGLKLRKIFSVLFDFNALERIIDHTYNTETDTLITIAGANHTKAIKKSLLTSLNGVLVNSISADIVSHVQTILNSANV